MRLESQNSVLKEKSSDIRNENDMLVAKIQKLQSRLSQEVSEGRNKSVTKIYRNQQITSLEKRMHDHKLFLLCISGCI